MSSMYEITEIVFDAFTDYSANAGKLTPAEWMQAYLCAKLPNKTVDAMRNLSTKTIEALDNMEKKKAAIEEAVATGKAAEDWFASNIMAESGGNGAKACMATAFFNGIAEAEKILDAGAKPETIDITENSEQWQDDKWDEHKLKDTLQNLACYAGKTGMKEFISGAFMKASQECVAETKIDRGFLTADAVANGAAPVLKIATATGLIIAAAKGLLPVTPIKILVATSFLAVEGLPTMADAMIGKSILRESLLKVKDIAIAVVAEMWTQHKDLTPYLATITATRLFGAQGAATTGALSSLFREYSQTVNNDDDTEYYRKAAAQGHADAQWHVGIMYEHGYGVEQDYAKAVEWYSKAAKQGYAKAQCDLGFCYQRGRGVATDYAKAVELFKKSAEQGYAKAQFFLGHCYEHGQGIAQDCDKAIALYVQSAIQGYPLAQEYMQRIRSSANKQVSNQSDKNQTSHQHDDNLISNQHAIAELLFDAFNDFSAKSEKQTPAEWLQGYLGAKLPSKTDDAIRNISGDILDTLDVMEKKKAAMEDAIEAGETVKDWFASNIMAESGVNGAKARLAAAFINGMACAAKSLDENVEIDAINISDNPEHWQDDKWEDDKLKGGLHDLAYKAGIHGTHTFISDVFMKASQESTAAALIDKGIKTYDVANGSASGLKTAIAAGLTIATANDLIPATSVKVLAATAFMIVESLPALANFMNDDTALNDSYHVKVKNITIATIAGMWIKQKDQPLNEAVDATAKLFGVQGTIIASAASGLFRGLSQAINVEWNRKAAEQGDADAQWRLGNMYDIGWYVAEDKAEAAKWYRNAAEQGHADAQYSLGLYYDYGRGVAEDKAEAIKWYRKAAEQGYAKAQHNLGVHYEKAQGVAQDYEEAIKWYRKAAEQGLAPSQCNLGVFYYFGYGVAQDKEKAIKLYRQAAEQGDEEAQCNLGFCYHRGRVVAQDFEKAVAWYTKSVEQGHARAQFFLGICYEQGQGVAEDRLKALELYVKSAEQGYPLAQEQVQRIASFMKKVLSGKNILPRVN